MIWFDGRITSMVFLSFVLMVASSVIAAWPDLATSVAPTLHRRALNAVGMYTGVPVPSVAAPSAASPVAAQASVSVAQWPSLSTSGYFWMLLNCLVSATYVLVMRKRIKLTGFKDWDTMFFNNLLSIPVLLVMSLLVENWSKETFEHNFPAERRTSLIIAVFLSGTGGVFISYTTAWCIRVTSSTTYSMVGALNKLPLALSGILFFGNPVTMYNSLGIAVGFVAGYVRNVTHNSAWCMLSARISRPKLHAWPTPPPQVSRHPVLVGATSLIPRGRFRPTTGNGRTSRNGPIPCLCLL